MIVRNDLDIHYRSIKAVFPYQGHARVHNEKSLAKAKKLLSAHGQILPIVVDETGVIIDGHLVHRALCELGYDEIRVVVLTNRDPATLKALRLALNRLPQDAKWDSEKLRTEFLSLIELDYDLDLTGFEAVEIDMALAVDEPVATAVEAESAATLIPPDDSVVKAGDVWRLGRHRIGCGDARDATLLAELVAGREAAAAIIDPPYNVAIGGFVSGLGKKRHREFAMASGEMTEAQFVDFLADSFETLKTKLIDGAICFCFMDWRHAAELLEAGKRSNLELKNLCIWAKTNPGMGSFYRSAHELCFVYKKGDAAHINNFELGQHGRSRSNVWTYAGMNVFGKDRDELLKAHPTVKPQPLLIDMMKDVTKRGALVLDTFLGSGSTLLAAEETGRTCVGLEIDPGYVEVAIRRWEKRTGQDAVHAATGETFDALRRRALESQPTDPASLEPIGAPHVDLDASDCEQSDG